MTNNRNGILSLGLSHSDLDIPSDDLPVILEAEVTDVGWDAHSDASGESQTAALPEKLKKFVP